jgi:hypothetical protein
LLRIDITINVFLIPRWLKLNEIALMSFHNRIRKSKEPIKFFNQCQEQNVVAIKRLMKNNKWLLSLTGKTQKSQVEWFRKRGVTISESGISRYAKGKTKSCSLTYLQFFAMYHGLDVVELMRNDLEAEYRLLNR